MQPGERIGDSAALLEGGDALRFAVEVYGALVPAFVVRHRGQVRAWLNRCAHVGVELDWQPGRVFDDSGLYLICAVHGALYLPESGLCIAGPCRGKSLTSVAVYEQGGGIFLGQGGNDGG